MVNLKSGALWLVLFGFSLLPLSADDILFIGNSFTFGAGDNQVQKYGGAPKLVEAIAIAKGKKAQTTMLAAGGKDWGYHLANPATDTALKSKPWSWVVLQDYSTKPTVAGNVDQFMSQGAEFDDRIAKESPQANIVLYETWAYDAKHSVFTGTSASKRFTNPDEMIGEISKNYTALQKTLQQKDPSREILLAPVGEAFARCIREHPEINLYARDHKHPSRDGSYLSALVIYATIFKDSPKGASAIFPTFYIDAKEAESLQTVADEATGK